MAGKNLTTLQQTASYQQQQTIHSFIHSFRPDSFS